MTLNVAWVLCCLPIVTIGPATLAAYWFVSHVIRDTDAPFTIAAYLRAVGHFFVPGLAWCIVWVVLLFTAYSNLAFWPHLLPGFMTVALTLLVVYIAWFLASANVYYLEGVVIDGMGPLRALRNAVWMTVANPLYSHMQPFPLVVALSASLGFRTAVFVILAAVVMLFASVAAKEAPLKPAQGFPLKPA